MFNLLICLQMETKETTMPKSVFATGAKAKFEVSNNLSERVLADSAADMLSIGDVFTVVAPYSIFIDSEARGESTEVPMLECHLSDGKPFPLSALAFNAKCKDITTDKRVTYKDSIPEGRKPVGLDLLGIKASAVFDKLKERTIEVVAITKCQVSVKDDQGNDTVQDRTIFGFCFVD